MDNRPPAMLRDLLKLKHSKKKIAKEPEKLEKIIKRFDSAGMSLGSLSPKAVSYTHLTLPTTPYV